MSLLTRLDCAPRLSVTQEWLLDALLAPSPQASEAFEKWVTHVDFDALDYSSLRLVPALYERYRNDPTCAPYRARMKGIYRYFLFRTHLVVADARRTLAALTSAGIEAMPFKGLALALQHHGNLALRPMADVDVLIHPEHLERARTVLEATGWTYRYAPERLSRDVHSHDYRNEQSGFDLHWYALHESPVPGIDHGLWKRASHESWQDIPLRWMAREDLVFVTLVNGMREPDIMRFEWIVDIVRIVGKDAGFDWSHVWNEAQRRGLCTTVFDALLMLNRFAPEQMSLAQINKLLDDDPAFSRGILQQLIAENRTEGLQHGSHLSNVLTPALPREAPWTLWLRRRRAYEQLSADLTTPKYIRCMWNEAGDIDALYLHHHHLPVLPLLFDCADNLRLKSLVRAHRLMHWRSEGIFRVEPGLLKLASAAALPSYQGRVIPESDRMTIAAGESRVLALKVMNDSEHIWRVSPDSPEVFAVTFHLLSMDGQMLTWEQPRTWLTRRSPDHLGFISPGQCIPINMRVHAPAVAGCYRLQLDLVHELHQWFSLAGVKFPELVLEVTAD